MTEEEHNLIREVHEFWFKPPIEGKPNRAAQIDEVLGAVRAGKIGTRLLLWAAGIIAAFGVIWSNTNGSGQ